jgi:hypothetical protein
VGKHDERNRIVRHQRDGIEITVWRLQYKSAFAPVQTQVA